MSVIARIRALHSYQIMLLAVALTVVIGQGIAMAMLAQGQVERARAFYAERDRLAKAAQDARDAQVAQRRLPASMPVRTAAREFNVATLQIAAAR